MAGVPQSYLEPDRGIPELVLHKRRVVPPFVTKMANEETRGYGKRCFHGGPLAQQELLSHSAVVKMEQTGPSMKETKFHAGFQRRMIPQPSALEIVPKEPAGLAESQAMRRDYLANRQNANGVNPLHGGPPIVGRHHNEAFERQERSGLRPAPKIEKIFQRDYVTPVDQELLKCKLGRQKLRRLNNKREGLFYTAKDWSVGDQLSTYDGYAVSEDISNNGSKKRFEMYGTERHTVGGLPSLPPGPMGSARNAMPFAGKDNESHFSKGMAFAPEPERPQNVMPHAGKDYASHFSGGGMGLAPEAEPVRNQPAFAGKDNESHFGAGMGGLG
mmetsp:Transcript_39173/g.70254  ORF Transcript_39173/g.70254 Transcript_39173/m.70254 type:complete len:329 (-) Transcript_39173:431-1417(-)